MWYKLAWGQGKTLMDNLMDRKKDPYLTDKKTTVAPEFGGRSRQKGFPDGHQSMSGDKEDKNPRTINNMGENHINRETFPGKGTGATDILSDPVDKLKLYSNDPTDVGPHNMPNHSIHPRILDRLKGKKRSNSLINRL